MGPTMTKRRQQQPSLARTERGPGSREAGLRVLERLQDAFRVGKPYTDVLKTLQKKTQARK
jgi:hypothetical protein